MKKKIFLFFLFISIITNAQVFQEDFNSGIPSTWSISNNGVGLGQSWMSSPAALGNNATIGAIVSNETATTANPIQDWLITPQLDFNGIANPQLLFVGKTTPAGPNRNSVLKVMISTSGTDFADFQPLETYTETFAGATNPISPNANFNLKTLNLAAYSNENVYIAFVMENTGTGKIWILDDVEIYDQCLDVTDIQISNLTMTSGEITWTSPSGANSFEIELVTGNNQPTGIATHTSTTNSITLPLDFGTNYKVYIRTVCTENLSSWVPSSEFTPVTPGTDCSAPLSITSLPYTHSDTTANYGDDYDGSPGESCGVTNNYLSGDDVVYAFTPDEDMIIKIEMIPQATYSGVFVYDSCDNIGVTCIAGVADSQATTRVIDELEVEAGTTYYILISTWASPQSVEYILNIQRVYCTQPIDLTVTNITQTSAELGWENGTGNDGDSWQIFVQDFNSGLPLTDGTLVDSNSIVVTELQNGDLLEPSLMYEFYVRSICSDGNFSPWSGPVVFNTLCVPFDLPFSEGFNSDSTTEICWSIINNNNDDRLWDLNYLFNPFEGDQSAYMNAYSWNGDNDDYLVSPIFNFNGQYRLRYKYSIGYGSSPQNFSVKMSQNGGNSIADFTTVLVPDAGYSNTTYKEKIVYLPNFVGEGAITWHVQTNAFASVYIDDVVIELVPECPEPYDIINTNSTVTSATIDWQQFGTVDSWDVILLPTGTEFTGDLTGLTVYTTTTKPYQVDGLESGSLFDVYVRSNCSGSTQSEWSAVGSAVTNVENDECVNAIEIPVNPETECIESVDGSFIGATNSNLGSVCYDESENDVWFQFTATASTHILSLSNIQGDSYSINSVLYSGSCSGGLTQLQCNTVSSFDSSANFNDLTIGQTYFIKLYTYNNPSTTTFTACLLTPLQPILVNNTQYTVPELVTDILINNPCANVSNITWSTGSNSDGLMGIGYFQKNGSSFEFLDGIILSTGNVLDAPGPKIGFNTQGASASDWGGDDDLSALLQTQNINGYLTNTTKLEFDFTAITNQMSFNFLFASEEYGGFQCNYSDVFAFFLTDLTTGVTTNIAVVPNTNIPVSVTTIRDAQYNGGCASANVEYFDSYYDGYDGASLGAPINFRGNTVPMIAQSLVTPGNTYHIKLAIADFGPYSTDSSYDSAVFIEGGSFELGSIDLGSDLTIEDNSALCAEQSYSLDSGVDTNFYNIEWLKDDEVIVGENGPVLEVTESGTYTIQATYIGSTCAITDDIIVEIYPPFIDDFNEPELIKVCSNSNTILDLTSNEEIMLNGANPSEFTFEYYHSMFDLENNIDRIDNSQFYEVNQSQSIYIKITNIQSGCVETMSFEIEFLELSQLIVPNNQTTCTAYLLPQLPDDQEYFTGPNGTGENLKENTYIGAGKHKIYVRTVNDICSEEESFEIDVIDCPISKGISPNGDGLNDYLDLEFFNAQKVQIFNRNGKEVYSYGIGYTNQWHGQSNNGDPLPSGTYFYVIVSPFETFTGWIQIVREIK